MKKTKQIIEFSTSKFFKDAIQRCNKRGILVTTKDDTDYTVSLTLIFDDKEYTRSENPKTDTIKGFLKEKGFKSAFSINAKNLEDAKGEGMLFSREVTELF